MAKSFEKDIEASARDPSPDHAVGEVKNINKNQDAALEFLRNQGDVRPMSVEDEKALLRKIDWRIIPLMFGCYTLRTFSTKNTDPVLSLDSIWQWGHDTKFDGADNYANNRVSGQDPHQLRQRHGPPRRCEHQRDTVQFTRYDLLRELPWL